ncbi:uncharacterized protein stumps [Palaemon carinicauda]|uniref:uncharacterized protein stumps n=1 Tax=Palaemon carinicauda TaxID=392227 RepID=UPI0035B5A044
MAPTSLSQPEGVIKGDIARIKIPLHLRKAYENHWVGLTDRHTREDAGGCLDAPNNTMTGESGEVHIVILYAQDGADWKNYLCELFTQMVPKEEGCQAVRVEVKNVEEIEDAVGGLEAVRLKEARLQIVIISPRFMAHIAGHGRSEIGQLFEPEKVLGLLLGVNDSQFSMAHLSALYSYKDWHRLKVRNSDLHFVEEVLCEAIKILNKNKLYVDFLDERAAKFKVSSRKITMTQKQLYIILNDEVAKSDSLQIFIEVPGRNPVPIQKYHLLNPYTVWFTMPEEFLKTSSILQINILVNGVDLGSRQLKCESHMDTLRDILACVANPTEFMCQALNINPICEDLDQKLAEKVKHRMPLTKIEEPSIHREVGEFPTWIHFSAYYGLDRLTWALLEVPGAEEALTTSNCYGHTPSILAYKKGFYSLAQKLEDVVLVSSLAVKACNIPRVYNNICVLKDSISPQEMYNCPPPPRPLATVSSSTKLPNYDTLPAPRVVTSCSSTPGGITPPDSVNTSPVPKVACNECQLATDSQNLTSTPVTDRASSTTASPVPVRHKTQAEKPLDCYVDMNVSSDRHGKLFEYREDVNTLIGAWNEKTNIKTFVERNQNEIDKMKCRLEAAHEELHSEMCAKITNDEVLPSVPVDNDKFPSDGQQHKNIVEKFITLLQDSPTNNENNFCEVNNTSIQCPCNGLKDTSSPPADFLKHKGSSQSCVLRDRPPVPMPRHESEIYLTADQLHTPKQYQILIAKKQFEEEEEEEKRKKLGKSSSYSNVPRTALVGKFPRSASGSSKKFSGTSPPKRTEENGIKEEVFYTKLLKD